MGKNPGKNNGNNHNNDKSSRDQQFPENRVSLCGRLTADPQQRGLPSGDTLVTFRVSVPRTAQSQSDWVDCSVWSGRIRATAARWRKGDTVAVEGALRRRFFRPAGADAARTRVEVEVAAGRRIARAPVRGS